MTKAGADIIVAHMGVTTGGAIGATSAQDRSTHCVDEIDAIAAAARAVRERRHRALPWRADRDAGRRRAISSSTLAGLPRLLRRVAMERLPVERALTEQTRTFKAIAGGR